MKRIFLYCFANSLSFCILASQELGSLMKDNLSLYQLSDETKEKIRERVRSFNRNRNRDKGVYAISLATGYRPYYALWRIFAGAEPPLFIRTLATTLDDALSRAMHLLQNCNVALALVENAFLNLFMEWPMILCHLECIKANGWQKSIILLRRMSYGWQINLLQVPKI